MVGKGTGTLVPEVFFRCEETTQERKRSGERKPLVISLSRYDRCQLYITRLINKQLMQ